MMLLTRHIETVRQQPEHVRRQVAFTVAAVLTGLIAFIWLGASVATGAFALKSTSFAEATSGAPLPVQQSSGGAGDLVGAVGAFFGGTSEGPARVDIVGADAAATPRTPAAEATILPF